MDIKNLTSINTLRAIPGEIERQTHKKFTLALWGSPLFVSDFYHTLTENMTPEGQEAGLDQDTKNQYIQILPRDLQEEDIQKIKSDAIICFLSLEEANRENFVKFREIHRLKPRSHLFIEEPATFSQKEELYEIMDSLYIYDREWAPPPGREMVEKKGASILAVNGDIGMAAAYRFPLLREAMAKKIIKKTSTQNMTVALASSLPTNIPVIGTLIGLLAVAGETTVLTGNQLKMCLQLAGIYGMKIDLSERIREIWPLVGSAIGFRALARSAVGFIPVAGPAFKASIAYGGTYLVGETVRWYYQKGIKLNAQERERIYAEARKAATQTAEEYINKIKTKMRKKSSKGEPKLDRALIEEDLKELESKKEEILKDFTPLPPGESEGENNPQEN